MIMRGHQDWVIPGMSGGPLFDVSEPGKFSKTVRGVCSFLEWGGSKWFCPIQQRSEQCINWFTAADDEQEAALRELFQYFVNKELPMPDVKHPVKLDRMESEIGDDKLENRPLESGYFAKNK